MRILNKLYYIDNNLTISFQVNNKKNEEFIELIQISQLVVGLDRSHYASRLKLHVMHDHYHVPSLEHANQHIYFQLT